MQHLLERLRRKVRIRPSRPEPQAPRMLHSQRQSILFSKLSAEIRLIIYSATLGDPVRPMHIVPFEDRTKRVTHARCFEMESPYPRFQHECFGWVVMGKSVGKRIRPRGIEDGIICLLLTCRIIHLEALDVLYSDNIFELKGPGNFMNWASQVTPYWHAIRHVSISTIFYVPVWESAMSAGSLEYWNQACEFLGNVESLRFVRIEIIMKEDTSCNYLKYTVDDSLLLVLGPCKSIRAHQVNVETNVEVPEVVKKALGQVHFTISVKQRPHNERLLQTTPGFL